MSFSKTIQMLIFDGNPNGRIMCELSNWNGRVYKISRNDLSEFSKREDSDNTGVYFLLGKNEINADTIYIGEAEKIFPRLKQHLNDENYWNDCIVVISKDDLLNKAHVKYLENRFYLLAKESNRAITTNTNIPTCSSLFEYDIAMLEEFISNAKLLVNTLGFKVFDSIEETAVTRENSKLVFSINAVRGANASGTIVSDGFAVFKGSSISSATVPSMSESLVKLRKSLYEDGTINEDHFFVHDHIFTSPSLAAAIVLGRSANGRTEWKTDERKTINDLEKEIS